MKIRMDTIKSYFYLTACVLLSTFLSYALENYSNLNLSFGPAWNNYLIDTGYDIILNEATRAKSRQVIEGEQITYPALGIDARLSFLNCFTANLTSNLGWFDHGRENTNTIELLSYNFVSGHAYRVNASAGLWLSCDNSCWALNPHVGYAYREQFYCVFFPEQFPAFTIPGKTRRSVKWQGPFIGLDSIYMLRDDIIFSVSYALTFAEYRQHEKSVQPGPDFSSSACISKTLGNYFKITSLYNISPCFDIGLGVWHESFYSKCGYSKVKFNPPVAIETNSTLVDAKWRELGTQLSICYIF